MLEMCQPLKLTEARKLDAHEDSQAAVMHLRIMSCIVDGQQDDADGACDTGEDGAYRHASLEPASVWSQAAGMS